MRSTLLLAALVPFAAAAAVKREATPTVIAPVPAATVIGTAGDKVESFRGIPFAQPPVGNLRLRPPQPLDAPLGKIDGTESAKACPQMFFTTAKEQLPANLLGTLMNLPLFQEVLNAGEDCLTLDVFRPAGVPADAKLPVLFWIYGGGFELGSTSLFNGESMAEASVDTNMPVIFVGVNYRVGGFGFMPGKEIKADGAGNLGLLDQKMGLQWVADNIAAFGGDPDKVTIWGESAGAISVLDQMIMFDGDNTYKGKPLFRGAIMNSGGIIPADPIDGRKGQLVYDSVVKNGDCASASDTLQCLRELPYDDFLDATNSVPGILSYFSVSLAYLPRPDGLSLTDSPDEVALAGKFAKVPFIIGDQEDEGTLFSLFQTNITTNEELNTYLNTIFFPYVDPPIVSGLVDTYGTGALESVTENSPFRTGLGNSLYPQFKKLAAILGDLTFTLTRRALLDGLAAVAPEVPSWSYLASYDYGTPVLGTFHGSDLLQVFFGIVPNYASRSIHSYYFSFVYNLDPNEGDHTYMKWPQWNDGKKKLMNFFANKAELINDDFRQDSYEYILEHRAELKI
ncbi:acetylcholinesterase/Butyrylcholinesterase [Eremomyces bilateralis CBS 781.70]|uniref:Carboxylic ester hydrolase n=1 Tax=Eremomyces bilateralis CBS 781.70 TaxID=1392243 RepID=A0A6G1GF72_9PEZI|nr:acetylcholinesterase/Butyrylcholinesterase [Eremomyces bilateralis CBS 781.70]KAF1816561.1 acetylcholinesterase/Butyrylcholinesterase [Eremomyces bilateralis CBS 781.70]